MAGVGPKRKYNAAGKNPPLRNKISSYLTGGMLEKFLPHPNLFCCNVKVPDIKYVMKQFSCSLYAYYSSRFKTALDE
jgi:hypothetical protein